MWYHNIENRLKQRAPIEAANRKGMEFFSLPTLLL